MRKLVFIFKPHEPLTTKLEHGYGIKVIYTAGVSHDEINNIANELDELKVFFSKISKLLGKI